MNTNTSREQRNRGRRGVALAVVLMLVVILGILGSGLLSLSATDAVEASKAISNAQSFWTAEAGLEQAKAIARKHKQARATLLFGAGERSWSGSTDMGSYAVDVVEVSASPPAFEVTSAGVSVGGWTNTVVQTIAQTNAMYAGVFGADSLSFQPNQVIGSYPTSGRATLGTDGTLNLPNNPRQLSLEPGTQFLIGQDTYTPPPGYDPNTFSAVGYIDPDPLGAHGGWLADQFTLAQTVNNNGTVVPAAAINGTTMRVTAPTTINPGNYYVTSADIRNTLTINTSNGIVNLFVHGPITASSPGTIIDTRGPPDRFRIYCDTSDTVTFRPRSSFEGFLYAPYATVTMQPNGDFRGVVWGASVSLQPQNSGGIYINTDMLTYGMFGGNGIYRVALRGWRQEP